MRTLAVAYACLLGGCLSFHPDTIPDPPFGSFRELGGLGVRFVDTGGGDPEKLPVLLVHGFGSSMAQWAELTPTLTAAGYRVVALDLKGHGFSARPEGDYSIAAQAKLVLDLADAAGLDRFVIVGHSWGSAVALQAALDAGDRVERIVLYNGMVFREQQPVLFSWVRVPVLGEFIYGVIYPERQDEKMAFAFFEPEKHITEEVVDRLNEHIGRPGTLAAMLQGIRDISYEDLEPRYGEVHQPVLLLWGREDQVTPIRWGERLRNELPHVRMVVLPRCGHLPMVEVPFASADELLDFLAESHTRVGDES